MASGSISPFRPSGTVSLVSGTSSAAVQLAGGGETVLVTNTAASLAYIKFGGDLTVLATTADMPVLPASRVLLTVNPLIQTVACMLTSGSGTVLFTRGDGSLI
jgi:hypothetical protein